MAYYRGEVSEKYFSFIFWSSMRESKFQKELKEELKSLFPGCVFIDKSGFVPGFPDLLVLLPNGRWFVLEIKESKFAHRQPNQEWYIKHFATMTYASVIYPENKEKVLNELQETFGSIRERNTRFSRRF